MYKHFLPYDEEWGKEKQGLKTGVKNMTLSSQFLPSVSPQPSLISAAYNVQAWLPLHSILVLPLLQQQD